MNFLVVWSEHAFEQMGLILRAMSHRRAEFARALKGISATLQDDPITPGESRQGADRIWFVGDLVISYRVDTESRAVEIASIRLARPQ